MYTDYTDAQQRLGTIHTLFRATALCLGLTILSPSAFALLNNGTPSKVAVPMTAAVNANLNTPPLETQSPNTTLEEQEPQIQAMPMTELLFEVERIPRSSEVEIAPVEMSVENITTPNEQVALQSVQALQSNSSDANGGIEVLELELEAVPLAQTAAPHISRRPTPSKIAVNADITAQSPDVQAPPRRDPRTHIYLSAPSKTPVAALEAISIRSSQLPLQLNASAVLIIDQNSREILYSKNPLDAMPIASITKLMTAMVVLDAKQSLNQKITITSADIDTLKSTSSRLYVGAQLTRRDLLHLTLMSSENRAAHALSRNYPGGKKAFIAAMNEKARRLGLTQTHYSDPTGLSNENRSSARDLVWLVDAAYKYDLIRNLSTSNKHRVTAGRTRLNYTTSNHLIEEKNWTIGLQKTGYIREAGYCLVMQTQISGKSFIMVLLDADAKNNRINDANSIRRWIST